MEERKIVMHANEHEYANWAHGECLRLEKENGILRGLMTKAIHELKKHDSHCADMLSNLMPNMK